MGGRIKPEQVAGLFRNGWQDSTGISSKENKVRAIALFSPINSLFDDANEYWFSDNELFEDAQSSISNTSTSILVTSWKSKCPGVSVHAQWQKK